MEGPKLKKPHKSCPLHSPLSVVMRHIADYLFPPHDKDVRLNKEGEGNKKI